MLDMSLDTVTAIRRGGAVRYHPSDHAWVRMSTRRRSPAAVVTVLGHGRCVWSRGARPRVQ